MELAHLQGMAHGCLFCLSLTPTDLGIYSALRFEAFDVTTTPGLERRGVAAANAPLTVRSGGTVGLTFLPENNFLYFILFILPTAFG